MSTAEEKDSPLVTTGLGKTYTRWSWSSRRIRTEALKSLDLKVSPGEVYGIVGPNGSGKSTTLKLAIGLIFPSRGRIQVNGYPGGDARGRERLGYLPENPALVPHLTPRDLLVGAGRIRGLARHSAHEQADRWLEALGLLDSSDQPIQEHSKGMAQRAAIGFAMVGDPDFLVLDEPLTGLDPYWRHRLTQLLDDFRCKGGTLLFSSHILSDVERLSDRVGIFHQGRLVREARPTDLLAERMEGYLVRFHGEEPPQDWDARAEGQGIWGIEVGIDGLHPTLEGLREASLEVVEVRPRGTGLEETFLAETGEGPSRFG